MTERSAAAERLLALARSGHDPSEADRQRVRASLHARYLAASALLAPRAAHGLGAASKLALSKVLIPLGLGMGLGVLGTTAVSYVLTPPELAPAQPFVAARPHESQPSARLVAAPASALAPEATQLEENVEAELAPASKPALPGAPALAPSAAAPSTLSPEDLRLELDGLRRAQRLLHAGQAAESLLALDELARQVPGGGLAEERAATRALSLCSLGQQRSREVEAFLTRYPNSVHASGVRSACSRAKFDLAPGNKTELGGSNH